MVIASGLGRHFPVGDFRAVLVVEGGVQFLPNDIVEVVFGRKGQFGVVGVSQVMHIFGACITVVLACHVVGHEVDDHFQSRLVRALQQSLKFSHAVGDVGSQVGVDVVIVLDGVGRAGPALYDSRVVGPDAVSLIVGLFQQSRKPNVRKAEVGNAFELGAGEVFQFGAAVLFDGSGRYVGRVVVRIEPGEYLVNKWFHAQ